MPPYFFELGEVHLTFYQFAMCCSIIGLFIGACIGIVVRAMKTPEFTPNQNQIVTRNYIDQQNKPKKGVVNKRFGIFPDHYNS